MSIPTQSITIKAGSDYSYELDVTGSGGAYNVTGCTFEGQIRRVPGGDLLATFTPSVIAPASNGKVLMSLTRDQTAAIPYTPGSTQWYHDVFLYTNPSSGPVQKLPVVLLCMVTVIPMVTAHE